MTTKKRSPKKTTKKENLSKQDNSSLETSDENVQLEELFPPRAKIGLITRLMILFSCIGVALLVYDKVEPGKIVFFKQETQKCETPIDEIKASVDQVLIGFSENIKVISDSIANNAGSSANDGSDFTKIFDSINNSKNEILNSVIGRIENITRSDIVPNKMNLDKENDNKQLGNGDDKAAESSESNSASVANIVEIEKQNVKNDIVINLVLEKISYLLEKSDSFEGELKSFQDDFLKFKQEVSNASQAKDSSENKAGDVNAGELNAASEITSKIKNALGKFVKVKKVDDKYVMLEQLIIEAEDALEDSDFSGFIAVMEDVKAIYDDKASIDDLIRKSGVLQDFEINNIKDSLREVLSMLEKVQKRN